MNSKTSVASEWHTEPVYPPLPYPIGSRLTHAVWQDGSLPTGMGDFGMTIDVVKQQLVCDEPTTHFVN